MYNTCPILNKAQLISYAEKVSQLCIAL